MIFKNGWKRIKKALLIALIACSLVVLSAGIILRYFKEDVKNVFINELNSNLNTKVKFEEFHLSLLHNFPHASVGFTRVYIHEAVANQNKENLLYANSIYFAFNIWDVFRNNYNIRKIEVQEAVLNVKVFADGTDNYHFWKTSEHKDKKHLNFELKKLMIANTRISYRDDRYNNSVRVYVSNLVSKGSFVQDNIHASTRISCRFLELYDMPELGFLMNISLKVKSDWNLNLNNNQLALSNTYLQFESFLFEMEGSYIYEPGNKQVNMKIDAEQMKVDALNHYIFSSFHSGVFEFIKGGKATLNATLKGNIGKGISPDIKVMAFLNHVNIAVENKIVLENISLTAQFLNNASVGPENWSVYIDKGKGSLKNGKIQLSGSIKDFQRPYLDIKTTANVDLSEIQEAMSFDTLQLLNGDLNLQCHFKGRINNIKRLSPGYFIKSKTTGTISIRNTRFQFVNDPHVYKNVNADLAFDNNDIKIIRLELEYVNSDISVTGYLRNFLSFLFIPDQQLNLDILFKSDKLYMDEMLNTAETYSDRKYNLTLPANIQCVFDLEIGHFRFHKFEARNITGSLEYQNKEVVLNNILLHSMDGLIAASGILREKSRDEFIISCSSNMQEVDINKMFTAFDDFGQQSMKAENIRGKLNANNLVFASAISKELVIDPSSVFAYADVLIEEGQLINYTPLEGLSRFINLEDLSNIRFSTLKNSLEIRNETIYIPEMAISSNAIDINISGQHAFDNTIHYQVKMLLSELMANKARKAKKENNDFGEVVDDGLGRTALYVLITGTAENPEFKYDRKGAGEKIIQDFRDEKHNLKKILYDEFGLYKKDSAILKTKKPQKKENTLIFEWNDDF